MSAWTSDLGPPPTDVVPLISPAALHEAVRAELTGPWAETVRRPWLWLNDFYVDLGLISLARAQAALSESRLITKTEALSRLERVGVDPDLVSAISRRRNGEKTRLTLPERLARARTVRRLMARGTRILAS